MKMLAFLLPLSFFWSSAACAAWCAEATERGEASAASAVAGDCAAHAPDACADCQLTAAASIVPERLSAKDAPAAIENRLTEAFRAPSRRSFDFVAGAPTHAPPRQPPAASLALLCRRRI